MVAFGLIGSSNNAIPSHYHTKTSYACCLIEYNSSIVYKSIDFAESIVRSVNNKKDEVYCL